MNHAGDPVRTIIHACVIAFVTLAVGVGHAQAQQTQVAPPARKAPTIPAAPRKVVQPVVQPAAQPPVLAAEPTEAQGASTPPTATPPAAPPTAAAPTAVVAAPPAVESAPKPTLDETRLTLNKWIETQQIISKERNDWQQGKEIVQGRIELVSKEVGLLQSKVAQAEAAVVESNKTRDELIAENDVLKDSATRLSAAVTAMEVQIRKLVKLMPEPIKARIVPLLDRVPVDPAKTLVSTAERFQNVLGILNELNKANSEIAVHYEIRTLADGSTSEVQVLYVGLSQAYYLSPRGEAGIGRPGDDGWQWQPAPLTAPEVLTALEILQGKHTPSFVPLPMKIQ